jgi:hypothetical protein
VLLTDAFNAPEVHAIADRLGLGRGTPRDASQHKIVDFLKDADNVRKLAAQPRPQPVTCSTNRYPARHC